MRPRTGLTTVTPVNWKPPLLDVVIAAAFVAMTVSEAVFSPKVNSPVEHVVVAGLAMAALAWRRRAPLVVAALVVGSNLMVNPSGDFSTLLSLVLVSFTVGAETTPPRNYLGLGLVFVPFIVASILEGFEPSDLAAGLVFFVGPWAVGVVLSGRIASAEEAVARAEQLERNRELEAASAAAEERTRIARELHDIVSHSISVVTIQTQAVRRRLGPEHAAEAADLAAVEATAREALAEMRRLFGVLRTEGEQPLALSPQPGLSELDRLVRQVGSGDLQVSLRVEGDPVPLSPGVDLAAYRIAQEGLTNALRHADATRADVLVRYLPGRLDVEVEDNGRGLTRSQDAHHDSSDGAGHGLVGIRERVALYGGTVELVPSSSGGVRLAVSLPLEEPTP
jgi:signal transduction histidine kinase